MATTPIPAYGFKEDLSPSNLENNKRLKASTLVNYLGQYKEFLKEQFPQHQFILFIPFGNMVCQFGLAIQFVNFVWQFNLAIQIGNHVWQFSLAFQFGNSVWQFCLLT